MPRLKSINKAIENCIKNIIFFIIKPTIAPTMEKNNTIINIWAKIIIRFNKPKYSLFKKDVIIKEKIN